MTSSISPFSLIPTGIDNKELQGLINKFSEFPSEILALKMAEFPVSIRNFVINQITGRRRAAIKFPTLAVIDSIIYPPAINVEQASSEATARFKASLVSGDSAIDLCSGLGIDAWQFSMQFKQIQVVDKNPFLSALNRFNFAQLQVENATCSNTNALSYLETNRSMTDFIYFDPSRRIGHHRTLNLNDFEPNPRKLISLALKHCQRLMMKLAPMADLQMVMDRYPELSELYVVSVEDECKEVLVLFDNDKVFDGRIKCEDLAVNGNTSYSHALTIEDNFKPTYGSPEKYLYLPKTAIIKAGAYNSLAKDFNLRKISGNTHIYTASEIARNFPGKIFECIDTIGYKEKLLKKKYNYKGYIIMKRNFPDGIEAIKKRLRIGDYGDNILIAYSNFKGIPELAICKMLD